MTPDNAAVRLAVEMAALNSMIQVVSAAYEDLGEQLQQELSDAACEAVTLERDRARRMLESLYDSQQALAAATARGATA